jgi:hypothetical protein
MLLVNANPLTRCARLGITVCRQIPLHAIVLRIKRRLERRRDYADRRQRRRLRSAACRNRFGRLAGLLRVGQGNHAPRIRVDHIRHDVNAARLRREPVASRHEKLNTDSVDYGYPSC